VRIQIEAEYPTPRKVQRASDAIDSGEVVAYPTDTVYALGCDPFNKKAVEQLYRVSKKPRSHLMTMICRDISQVSRYAMLDDQRYRLIRGMVPGPYCFILPATKEAPKHITSKRRTLGIRIAEHPVLTMLMAKRDTPLLSTSATFDNEVLTDPEDIEVRFPGLYLVLDAGLGGSIPSTIIDASDHEPVVVREGLGLWNDGGVQHVS